MFYIITVIVSNSGMQCVVVSQKWRTASVCAKWWPSSEPCVSLFLFLIQLSFLFLSFSRMSEAAAESQWSRLHRCLTDSTKESTCQDFRCCQVSLQTLCLLKPTLKIQRGLSNFWSCFSISFCFTGQQFDTCSSRSCALEPVCPCAP